MSSRLHTPPLRSSLAPQSFRRQLPSLQGKNASFHSIVMVKLATSLLVFAAALAFAMACVCGAASVKAPLRPRMKAPQFSLMGVVGQKFERIKLEDYLGKWVVLFFYPFDFTFVCPTEITAVRRERERERERERGIQECRHVVFCRALLGGRLATNSPSPHAARPITHHPHSSATTSESLTLSARRFSVSAPTLTTRTSPGSAPSARTVASGRLSSRCWPISARTSHGTVSFRGAEEARVYFDVLCFGADISVGGAKSLGRKKAKAWPLLSPLFLFSPHLFFPTSSNTDVHSNRRSFGRRARG